MKKQPKEPWRIIVGVLSVLFIAFMWVKKDMLSIYTALPAEQALPLIVTTLAVSLLKLTLFTGVFFAAKWVVSRVKKGCNACEKGR